MHRNDLDVNDNFIVNILKEEFDVEISEHPDYLFYSVFSRDFLDYNCVRIFYTVENLVPDFNLCDYAIGFHYLDFEDRYLRYPYYLLDADDGRNGGSRSFALEKALCKHENIEEKIAEKTDFCAFVYTNAEAAPCRRRIFEALSKYKKVDSGGRYMNNTGGAVSDKYEFQRKHRFVIAFENTSSPGYTTEKLVEAFAAGAVPIYWGDPKVDQVFNQQSFINCAEYGLTAQGTEEAIAQIVKKVISVDRDESQYRKMLCEPAFLPTYSVDGQREALRRFLLHIVEQPLEDAYRRNRYYWGERYERKQRIGSRFYWACRKVIPLRDGIMKICRIDRASYQTETPK